MGKHPLSAVDHPRIFEVRGHAVVMDSGLAEIYGAIMAAIVLNSPRAVSMSVYVVRAFVRLRGELLANATMEKRLERIEKTLIAHDGALRDIYEKIRPLLLPPPETPRRRIGFNTERE